jgi:rsbT co-antagonist protein RsbR
MFAALLAEQRPAIVEAATDWVIGAAVDLRGQRPRHESLRLVERVVGFNEALILHGDARPLQEFIELVTSYRAASEFHLSTPLRGFVSFRMALLPLLGPPAVPPEVALVILDLVDEAYFSAIFRMVDMYIAKLNHTIVSRREALEVELQQLTQQRMRELDASMEVIESQRQTLRTVSLPIIRVWDGVLVLPLIGELGDERGSDMAERLLAAIVEQRARLVLIDLTGLVRLDERASIALERTLRSVKLLGARPIVVGISAQAAATTVGSGHSLQGIDTFASLGDGLRTALLQMGFAISRTSA